MTTKPPEMNKFETRMYRFMRISGIFLLPLAFGHLAIMHIFNSVYDINHAWVIARWDFLPWRLYDGALLWFAGIHGFNGLRTVINDYVHSGGLKRVLGIVMIIVMLFVFVLGTIALLATPFSFAEEGAMLLSNILI